MFGWNAVGILKNQCGQKWKNRFPKGYHIASFVVGWERETLFIGIYDVADMWKIEGPYDDPVIGHQKDELRAWHDLRLSERMQEFKELLTIEWGPGKLAWRQRANEKNKAILELRTRPRDPQFPGYLTFQSQLKKLLTICPTWQTPLQQAKGVYILTFDDGMQYVGSATGDHGFWQRWQNYIANGHGGNKVLIRDNRDARCATVSILEVSGSAQTDSDIIGREMNWQLKLGTRAKPLD